MNETMGDDARNEIDKRNRIWDLYEAAAEGDWGKAEEIYEDYPDYVGHKFSDKEGDTALHVAVIERRNDFVKNLVGSKYVKKEDLEMKNGGGNTAFILAAMLGNNEVVRLMLEQNKDLVNIRNREMCLPVQMAASLRHEDMVKILYNPTEDRLNHDAEYHHLNNEDRILLLLTLIENDIYDVALSMVKNFPLLAVSREIVKKDANGENGKMVANGQMQRGKTVKQTDGNGETDTNDEIEDTDGNGKTNTNGQNAKGETGENGQNANGETSANGQKTVELGETALHVLARKPLVTLNSKQGILNRFYYRYINSNMVEKMMHPKALELLELLWEKIVNQRDYDQISELIQKPSRLISVAAKQGNIEFLSFLINKHPALKFEVDKNNYSIFHIAIEYRHENIFKLIHVTPSIKDVIAALEVGKDENNILHLAANLPPDQNRLNVVSGAALQMLLELSWFKEVSELMPPSCAGEKNKKGKTAQTLFTESHEELRKVGEEWMKITANSCLIVATLITTIVFAAAFTVPGGMKDDTGAPHFLRKASFITFAIFDIISLVSSSCSILTFLSILTARYAEEDFLWSLPTKLLVGLVTLFISIIAMMVVFCTTLFIIFDGGTKVPAILTIALASIPVITFIWQQTRLFLDVVRLMSFSLGEPKKSSTRTSKGKQLKEF